MDGPAVDGPGSAAPLLTGAVAFGTVLVVLAVSGASMLVDTDTSWHIASGAAIVDNGALPTVDSFSFTRAGEPWIAKEWLSQLLLYGADRIGGWTGVVALTATATAAAFGLLAAALGRRLSGGAVVIAVGCGFVLAAPHILARPHVLALPVAVAWTIALVDHADDSPSRPPWAALALMVLWANLHAGFTLGLVLAVGFALDAVVRAWPDGDGPTAARRWAGFVGAAALAAIVTPYGPGPLLVTADILGLGPALEVIVEWQPQDVSSPTAFEVILLAAVGGALVAGVRLRWTRTLILLGLVHLALSAVRNGDVLGLLAPLLVAAPIAAASPEIAASRSIDPARRDVTATGPTLAAVAASLLAAAVVLGVTRPVPPRVLVPADATTAVLGAGATRVLHEYAWGGYLIDRGVPTFVDGRTELFGGRFVADHAAAVALEDIDLLERLLIDHDIDATMLRPATPAVALLDRSPAWRRVHEDRTAIVHVHDPASPPGLGLPVTADDD